MSWTTKPSSAYMEQMSADCRMILTSPLCSSSPKRNPNLLQRSEIVALINTLHRISESLQSVEVFRKLYAKTQEEGQNKAIASPEEAGREASSRVNQPIKSSPRLWYRISQSVERLRMSCKRSIWVCVQHLRRGPLHLLARMFGFDQTSQDDQSTRSEL